MIVSTDLGARPVKTEEWRVVEGYEGIYAVSDAGNVMSMHNMKHAFRTGLQSNRGENHSRAVLTDAKVLENPRVFGCWYEAKRSREVDGRSPWCCFASAHKSTLGPRS